MFRNLSKILLLLALVSSAEARTRFWGYCEQGGLKSITASINSTSSVQGSYPGCTVQVLNNLDASTATIYSDNAGTAKGNPFTADNTTGYYFYYADSSGTYNERISATGLASFTRAAINGNDTGSAQYPDLQTAISASYGTDLTVNRAFSVPAAVNITSPINIHCTSGIILTRSANVRILVISASNVKIDGCTFDGNRPGGVSLTDCLYIADGVSNLTITNSTFQYCGNGSNGGAISGFNGTLGVSNIFYRGLTFIDSPWGISMTGIMNNVSVLNSTFGASTTTSGNAVINFQSTSGTDRISVVEVAGNSIAVGYNSIGIQFQNVTCPSQGPCTKANSPQNIRIHDNHSVLAADAFGLLSLSTVFNAEISNEDYDLAGHAAFASVELGCKHCTMTNFTIENEQATLATDVSIDAGSEIQLSNFVINAPINAGISTGTTFMTDVMNSINIGNGTINLNAALTNAPAIHVNFNYHTMTGNGWNIHDINFIGGATGNGNGGVFLECNCTGSDAMTNFYVHGNNFYNMDYGLSSNGSTFISGTVFGPNAFHGVTSNFSGAMPNTINFSYVPSPSGSITSCTYGAGSGKTGSCLSALAATSSPFTGHILFTATGSPTANAAVFTLGFSTDSFIATPVCFTSIGGAGTSQAFITPTLGGGSNATTMEFDNQQSLSGTTLTDSPLVATRSYRVSWSCPATNLLQ